MVLSIIIPYYNANAFIGRMLDSLLDQGLPPSEYEIIVVDDGSDEEPAVLKEYAGRHPQIRYCPNGRSGLSASRNFGMSVASGEWLYFCDSDDYVQPRVFGGIIAAAERLNFDIINAGFKHVGPSDSTGAPARNFDSVAGPCSGREFIGAYPEHFAWGIWACLMRRSFVEASGIRFENLLYVEDRIFKLQMMQHCPREAFIDVDLYYHVINPGSVMHYTKKHDMGGFSSAMLRYLDVMTEVIESPATPVQSAGVLAAKRTDDSLGLLTNLFRYGSVSENENAIARMEAAGLYPVGASRSKSSASRIVRGLMNRKRLWLCLLRIFHLVPLKLRLRL